MGKTTRYFKQSKRSRNANTAARNYGPVFKNEGWHVKLFNLIRARGKSNAAS